MQDNQDNSGGLNDPKGLVASILDFSFRTFVTPRIISIVYVLSLVGLVLGTIGWLIAAFRMSSAFGESGIPFMQIILAPFVLAFGVVVIRIYCEMLLLAFRVVEHLSSLSRSSEQIARLREPLDRIADGMSQPKPAPEKSGP